MINTNFRNFVRPFKGDLEKKKTPLSYKDDSLKKVLLYDKQFSNQIKVSFKGIPCIKYSEVNGIMYSEGTKNLSDDEKLSKEEIENLYNKCIDKKKSLTNNLNDSRTNIKEVASCIGENAKTYTACNAGFNSSRWGLTAGILSSCMAINDFNKNIKAIALTDLSHDKRALEWLSNINKSNGDTRGGDKLQVITKTITNKNKEQLHVTTLSEFVNNFVDSSKINHLNESKTIDKEKLKPENVFIDNVLFSLEAQNQMKKLNAEYDIDIEQSIKDLIKKSQGELNTLNHKIIETNGEYDNAPISKYRFSAAVLDNEKNIHTATNTEFYKDGYLNQVMCAERTAMGKAINDGADKILAIAINNNQNHDDIPCAECLGWMSTERGGPELLIATYMRDENKNKTNTVEVKTHKELFPKAYKPSPLSGNNFNKKRINSNNSYPLNKKLKR